LIVCLCSSSTLFVVQFTYCLDFGLVLLLLFSIFLNSFLAETSKLFALIFFSFVFINCIKFIYSQFGSIGLVDRFTSCLIMWSFAHSISTFRSFSHLAILFRLVRSKIHPPRIYLYMRSLIFLPFGFVPTTTFK